MGFKPLKHHKPKPATLTPRVPEELRRHIREVVVPSEIMRRKDPSLSMNRLLLEAILHECERLGLPFTPSPDHPVT